MKKRLVSMFLILAMCMGLAVPAYATTSDDSEVRAGILNANINDSVIVAKISVTDLDSGKTTSLPLALSTFSLLNITEDEGELEQTAYCEVYVDPQNQGIMLLDSEGKDHEVEHVKARLSVTYKLSANKEQIKVTNFNGGWTTPNSLYYLTDRQVGLHTGVAGLYSLQENISTNSFNYDLNWDYTDRSPSGITQPRAWSDARIQIAGMETSKGTLISIDMPFASF